MARRSVQHQPWVYTSEGLLLALQETYPEVKTGDFLSALKQAVPFYAPDCDWFRRRPDAYAIREGEIDLFEIEITHPLPPDTLLDLSNLWFDLDALGVRLSLYIVSRYGHINPVNLQDWYYELSPYVALARRSVPPDEAHEAPRATPGA